LPGENSFYRKIQVVLDVAVSVDVSSLTDLQEEIKSRRPPNFLTKKFDPKIDDFVPDVSERSIRRTANFCYRLGLVGADGGLTEIGRKALHKKQFDGLVAGQIRSFLKKAGVNLMELNQIMGFSTLLMLRTLVKLGHARCPASRFSQKFDGVCRTIS
jgi:hypothetical protein